MFVFLRSSDGSGGAGVDGERREGKFRQDVGCLCYGTRSPQLIDVGLAGTVRSKINAEDAATVPRFYVWLTPWHLLTNHSPNQIMLAAYHGHAPLVKLLLQHGADPNRLNDRGQSPLAGVVFKNERDCIQVLLDGGADPEVGEPNALQATQVFKQEEYEGMFREQIEKLKGSGGRAMNGNGVGH